MWHFLAAGVYFACTLIFLSRWLQGKAPELFAWGVALVGAAVGAVGAWALCPEAMLMALPGAGLAAFLVYSRLKRRRNVLPGAVLAFGALAPWLPLSFGPDSRTALILAVVLGCVMMMADPRMPDPGGDRQTEGRYQWWIWLPAGVILPAILCVTPWVGMPPAVSASCLFVLLGLLVCLVELLRQRNELRQSNELMGRWQQESRDYMNTIRSQRHDFNLHLHAISGLVKIGEYEQVQQYVNKLVAEATAVNDIMPVADAVVGSMLYNMRQEARAHGSDISYHITYDMQDILCNGFVCNKIVGNLLQNAIDALLTQQAKDFGIHLRIFKRRGSTVIAVENYFDADPATVARVFEPGYSTKLGHEGIGLSMVLRAVEQCGGRIYPEFEEKRIRFVVNIPNKVTLQGGEQL